MSVVLVGRGGFYFADEVEGSGGVGSAAQHGEGFALAADLSCGVEGDLYGGGLVGCQRALLYGDHGAATAGFDLLQLDGGTAGIDEAELSFHERALRYPSEALLGRLYL